MFASDAIAWLITYLLHSTLLLGGAWLASRRLARWSVRAEEAVWRFALVGGLLTATLQIAAGWEPLAGRWSLPESGSGSAAASFQAPAAGTAPAPSLVPAPARREAPAREAAGASLPAVSPSAPAMGLALWALGAALLLARSLASYQGFHRRLRLRPRVVGGTLHAQLERLSEASGLRRPVRLTCSSRVPVPVALGLREPEICVPPRALVGLTAEQQEGLLAHELAHVARRDAFWLVFNQLLASVLFVQPLNWVARRRLREISELLSDEWAVGRTGRPVSLARCLAEVAGWSARSVRALPVPGMADRPSTLGHRIRRLLDEARSPERPVRPLWLGIAMIALLAFVIAAAPVVSAAVETEDGDAAVAAETREPDEADEPEEADEAEAAAEADEVEEEDSRDHDGESFEREHDEDLEGELDWESEEMERAFESFGDAFETAFEEIEPAFEAAFAGLDGELEAAFDLAALEDLGDLEVELGGLEDDDLSPEERERLEREMERVGREMERVSRQVEETLRPQMEKLQQEIERKLKPEMEKLQREIERSLQPEMERLQKQLESMQPDLERLESEARRLQAEGGLSEEERERITREALRISREASERAMASAEVRKAIAESQRQSQEAARRVFEEHREEIEKMRREIEEQTRVLREEARWEVERSHRERRRIKEKEREDN